MGEIAGGLVADGEHRKSILARGKGKFIPACCAAVCGPGYRYEMKQDVFMVSVAMTRQSAQHATGPYAAQHASAASGSVASRLSAAGAQPQVDRPPLAAPSFVSAPL